jgi:hypothetical protein
VARTLAWQETIQFYRLSVPRVVVVYILTPLAGICAKLLWDGWSSTTDTLKNVLFGAGAGLLGAASFYLWRLRNSAVAAYVGKCKELRQVRATIASTQSKAEVREQAQTLYARGMKLLKRKVVTDGDLLVWADDHERWATEVRTIMSAHFNGREQNDFTFGMDNTARFKTRTRTQEKRLRRLSRQLQVLNEALARF